MRPTTTASAATVPGGPAPAVPSAAPATVAEAAAGEVSGRGPTRTPDRRRGWYAGHLRRLLSFLAVGGSGVLVNTAALWVLLQLTQMSYLAASLIATQVAIVWNFPLLRRFVFAAEQPRPTRQAFPRFWLLTMALMPVQLGLLALFVDVLGVAPVPANVAVLGLVFVVRYLVTLGIFRGERAGDEDTAQAALAGPAQAAITVARGDATVQELLSGVGRLMLPMLATAIALPQFVIRIASDTVTAPTMIIGGVALILLLIGMLALAAPRRSEPEVHDRQVDLIIGAVLLAFGVWQIHAGSELPHEQLTTAAVVGACAFLAGATTVLLGTRLAARWRWLFAVPLVLIEPIRSHPWAAAAFLVVAGIALAWGIRRVHGPATAARHSPKLTLDSLVGVGQRFPGLGVPAATVLLVAVIAR